MSHFAMRDCNILLHLHTNSADPAGPGVSQLSNKLQELSLLERAHELGMRQTPEATYIRSCRVV